MHKKSVPLIRQMGTTDCGIAASDNDLPIL